MESFAPLQVCNSIFKRDMMGMSEVSKTHFKGSWVLLQRVKGPNIHPPVIELAPCPAPTPTHMHRNVHHTHIHTIRNIHANLVTCVIRRTHRQIYWSSSMPALYWPTLSFCPAVKRLSVSLSPHLTHSQEVHQWLKPKICPKYLDHTVRLARVFQHRWVSFAPFPIQSMIFVICWFHATEMIISVVLGP